jgi:predicted RNase H-like HicB family nuclease
MKLSLRFPVAISPPTPGSVDLWNGIVVDIPSCVVRAKTLDELRTKIPDVISLRMSEMQNVDLFELQVFEAHRTNPAYEKHLWAFVNVEFEMDEIQ